MGWLITAEVVSLLAGLFLLFSSDRIRQMSHFLDRPITYIDNLLESIRIPTGILLVIAGGWIISVAFGYSLLWYLHVPGVVIVLFGLCYLFLPNWLSRLSIVADRFLFSTDDFILTLRKSAGVASLVCAVYIFFAVVYMSAK